MTCDNLLTAVKQTVAEDTTRVSTRRETELTINLREAVFEEQQLSAKVSRFEGEYRNQRTVRILRCLQQRTYDNNINPVYCDCCTVVQTVYLRVSWRQVVLG